MKTVLDTNVLVSGIFFSGPPHRILEAWKKGKIELVVTMEIVEEYRRVVDHLERQFKGIEAQTILDLIIRNAAMVEAESLRAQICDDPDDDKFIAAAIACDAKVIVSGDKHLLKVSGFMGISVLRPRDFVDAYLR